MGGVFFFLHEQQKIKVEHFLGLRLVWKASLISPTSQKSCYFIVFFHNMQSMCVCADAAVYVLVYLCAQVCILKKVLALVQDFTERRMLLVQSGEKSCLSHFFLIYCWNYVFLAPQAP